MIFFLSFLFLLVHCLSEIKYNSVKYFNIDYKKNNNIIIKNIYKRKLKEEENKSDENYNNNNTNTTNTTSNNENIDKNFKKESSSGIGWIGTLIIILLTIIVIYVVYVGFRYYRRKKYQNPSFYYKITEEMFDDITPIE